jgi:hypothetical protein
MTDSTDDGERRIVIVTKDVTPVHVTVELDAYCMRDKVRLSYSTIEGGQLERGKWRCHKQDGIFYIFCLLHGFVMSLFIY